MKYQELRDYALQCSLEHHLCNVEELLDEGKTPADILVMVEGVNDDGIVIFPFHWEDVEVAEAYEYYEPASLAEAIEDMRGVFLHEFMVVLSKVNGEEWATSYKEEAEA